MYLVLKIDAVIELWLFTYSGRCSRGWRCSCSLWTPQLTRSCIPSRRLLSWGLPEGAWGLSKGPASCPWLRTSGVRTPPLWVRLGTRTKLNLLTSPFLRHNCGSLLFSTLYYHKCTGKDNFIPGSSNGPQCNPCECNARNYPYENNTDKLRIHSANSTKRNEATKCDNGLFSVTNSNRWVTQLYC